MKSDISSEKIALETMFNAWRDLRGIGWQEIIYCPKDGSMFLCIEPGSTGIHHCTYDDKGRWWIHEHGDMWPSHPILWKPIEEEKK